MRASRTDAIQVVVTLDRETFVRLLEEAQAQGLPAASRAAARLLREALGTAAPEPDLDAPSPSSSPSGRDRGLLRLVPPVEVP
jgi:hypothetical protein